MDFGLVAPPPSTDAGPVPNDEVKDDAEQEQSGICQDVAKGQTRAVYASVGQTGAGADGGADQGGHAQNLWSLPARSVSRSYFRSRFQLDVHHRPQCGPNWPRLVPTVPARATASTASVAANTDTGSIAPTAPGAPARLTPVGPTSVFGA